MNLLKFKVLADAIATLSKDPKRKVGAVAVNDDGVVLSLGYNGFPRGVKDDVDRYADRDIKLMLVSHAEQNLVAQAAYSGHSLKGSTVIVTGLYPCSSCAKSLIQAGVKHIYAPNPLLDPKWTNETLAASLMFKEAGLTVSILEP